MKYLDKLGLNHLIEKIKEKMVTSDVIRRIEVVDVLPEVEEGGVLYLVKESETPIEPEKANLYYQDTEKDYTSSSGINYIFGIDKTLTLNGTPKSNASTFSNNMTLNLSTSKIYKFSLKPKSGNVTVNNDLAYRVYFYNNGSNNGGSSLVAIDGTDSINEVSGTFVPTIDGDYTYGVRIYVYANNVYDNLKFDVVLEEV